MNKYSASRNLGFITGPLLLVMGILGYMKEGFPSALAITLMIMGAVRLGLTIYSMVLSKKENNE